MYSFLNLEPVHCSMSGSNCCSLFCIQISQEAGQVIWNSHIFQNFPVCCEPDSQRLYIVSEAEVNDFWNSLPFPMIQQMLAIWNLVFSKSSLYIWTLSFHILLKPPWRILSIILLACEMSAIVKQFEHSSALPFSGIGMKTDLFHSYGYSWVFLICWNC